MVGCARWVWVWTRENGFAMAADQVEQRPAQFEAWRQAAPASSRAAACGTSSYRCRCGCARCAAGRRHPRRTLDDQALDVEEQIFAPAVVEARRTLRARRDRAPRGSRGRRRARRCPAPPASPGARSESPSTARETATLASSKFSLSTYLTYSGANRDIVRRLRGGRWPSYWFLRSSAAGRVAGAFGRLIRFASN